VSLKVLLVFLNIALPEDDALSSEACWGVCEKIEN
jgi:hypothetical protein